MSAVGVSLKRLHAWTQTSASDAKTSQALQTRGAFSEQAAFKKMGKVVSSLLFDAPWYVETYDPPLRKPPTDMAVLEHYLKFGSAQGHDPNPWFREDFYRRAYQDVQAALAAGQYACGFQHYLASGIFEHRSPNADFNELAYVGLHPDVLEAVRNGTMMSGYLHYTLFGKQERREQCLPAPSEPLLALPLPRPHMPLGPSAVFAEDLYLAANADVYVDGEPLPGMRHWIKYGIQEDLDGTRERIEAWVDALYLRANPDLGPHIGFPGQASGYSHFLMHGHAEGRRWSGETLAQRGRMHLHRAMRTSSPVPASLADAADGPPLICVIVPVYDPDIAALQACIESVRAQSYPHWQLRLADDGSTTPEVTEALVGAEQSDPRVRVVFAPRNGGISAASNLALAECQGEFIALLDHDDLLAPDALLHVARAFRSAPDVDIVYTDEGKLDGNGGLTSLSPKPGWSPELLLSTMYVGHLTAYRRALVQQVGGFRPALDGTQDYDLLLRASERARVVRHVPLPLYMWRMSPASTASSLDAKPGVLELQRYALESTLLRRGTPGRVLAGHAKGHWRVVLNPPRDLPLVSIVIPTAGQAAKVGGRTVDLVVNCVKSLASSETYPNHEILVVHNGDLTAKTLLGLASFARVRLIHYDRPQFNLSEKINLGVEAAAGTHVLLLNDDMQAESKEIIQAMFGRMFEGVGIVGGRLLYPAGDLQHAGVVWTAEGPTHAMIGEHRLTRGPAERLRVTHNCLAVSGACMFFKRDVFLGLGGFPVNLPTNYNDVALCLKAQRAGLRVVFNADVTMFHFESLSKVGTYFWELQRLILDYPGLHDPYLNPSFSNTSPFYELVDPEAQPTPSYRAWMVARIDQRRALRPQAASIRFSFILSVYETPVAFLKELEATVFGQTYTNWELVLVDNGCRAEATIAWIDRVAALPNVVSVRLEANQGIMGGYGAAFRAATGGYVVPIDSDDVLTLDSLDVLAHFLEKNGLPDAVYSDEDKCDSKSNTHSPFLKPDWDPLLFTNICYVAHVCAVRRSTAVDVGAYQDHAASGCHDWDTFLRVWRAGGRVMHVPEVLYSWRIHAGSTASIETGNKPYTVTSQKHVLDQHLRLTGLGGAFEVVHNSLFPHDGMWRLRPLEAAAPSAAVLVLVTVHSSATSRVLYDLALDPPPPGCKVIMVGGEEARRCLDHLLPDYRRALWPDGPPVILPLEDAVAACVAESRVIALVDAGAARPEGAWLREGLGMFAFAPDVGAVGGQVILPDGRVAWRAGFAGFSGMAGSPDHGRGGQDSGYHGMGWCQRTCDAVPSVCFFAVADLVQEAVAALAGRPFGMRELAGQVALAAWRAGGRILYTPFVSAALFRDVPVDPILPRTDAALRQGRPNYYPAALGGTLRTAWQLTHAPADMPRDAEARGGR